MSRWPGEARKQPTTFGGLSRSELMSRVGSVGNRTTEIRLATLLRTSRLTGWRRHLPLPGRPDFAWPDERIALFVDGCFWHGHACARNLSPKTNSAEWRRKILGNRRRDRRNSRKLRAYGWRVIRIWECQLSKAPQVCVRRIARALLNLA